VQDPDGSPNERGIRQFTVGTGGKQLYPPVRIAPNSEQIIASTFGLLELTLHADSYDWRFHGWRRQYPMRPHCNG
jgi:hypothetical protein